MRIWYSPRWGGRHAYHPTAVLADVHERPHTVIDNIEAANLKYKRDTGCDLARAYLMREGQNPDDASCLACPFWPESDRCLKYEGK